MPAVPLPLSPPLPLCGHAPNLTLGPRRCRPFQIMSDFRELLAKKQTESERKLDKEEVFGSGRR